MGVLHCVSSRLRLHLKQPNIVNKIRVHFEFPGLQLTVVNNRTTTVLWYTLGRPQWVYNKSDLHRSHNRIEKALERRACSNRNKPHNRIERAIVYSMEALYEVEASGMTISFTQCCSICAARRSLLRIRVINTSKASMLFLAAMSSSRSLYLL